MFDGPQSVRSTPDESLAMPPLSLQAPAALAPHDASAFAVPSLLRQLLRQQHTRWFVLLGTIELPLLAGLHALAIVTAQSIGAPLAGAGALWALTAVTWLSMIALGLYQRHANVEGGLANATATRLVISLAVGAIASLVVAQLGGTRMGGVLLTLALGYGALGLALVRWAFLRLAGEKTLRRRALVLGAGTRAAEAHGSLGETADRALSGARILGYLPLPSDRAAFAHPNRLRPGTQLLEFVREHEIDEVVVAADDRRGSLPMAELVNCRLQGIDVLNLDQFYERELGKTALELILPSWCVFTRAFDLSAVRRMSKRAFDVAAASTLLLLTWPLMLATAAAILLESGGRGPVLYRQQRVGRNGQAFWLHKFRSMRTDAERDGVARFASTADDRVTRVGRFIRKVRLDELPQLWNVLRGEMSVVGPRPERPEFVQGFALRVPHYGLRHCVRPGLTGWAQLRYPYGASEADTIEKLRYDLYYVKYQSLRFDLTILLETVEVVLFGRGGR